MVSGKTLGVVSIPRWRPGPAMLVTAAFIGPGTVTACAAAGTGFGAGLLWALAFATLATIVLQTMASRVAIVTGKGLGEAILSAAPGPAARLAIAALIIAALGIGNAAYQSGNIAGTALGLAMLGVEPFPADWIAPLGIGLLAGALVALGKPRWLEKLLTALVLLMAAAFIAALPVLGVDWQAVGRGLVPSLPEGSLFTAVALIGTTIVPYNLYLHAASARDRFARSERGLAESRLDTLVAVSLGGLLSMAVVLVGAAAGGDPTSGAAPLESVAARLESGFGEPARLIFAFGLLGAGFSSALTAPLATGYVMAELLGGATSAQPPLVFRATALIIVATGTLFACLGINPTELILIAQSANGVLLPASAAFLLWVASRRATMGGFASGILGRVVGGLVLLICTGLGLRLVLRALGYAP